MQRTNELDSLTFAAMLRQGAVQLGRDKKVINDLNVFPIPDGDTGDNMLMTLKAGCASLQSTVTSLQGTKQKPRVALLNVGKEAEKVDKIRQKAYFLLSETPEIHFVVNMESRDLLSGNYDVVTYLDNLQK